MFKFTQNPKIWWPVTISYPIDGGKVGKATFEAHFQVKDADELGDLGVGAFSDVEVLSSVLLGWKGVADEEGNEIEYSDENKEMFLKNPYVRKHTALAYLECVNGAKRKN